MNWMPRLMTPKLSQRVEKPSASRTGARARGETTFRIEASKPTERIELFDRRAND
jgi:hypothetical protein